jgi:hydrogenase expression/formation protein HypC
MCLSVPAKVLEVRRGKAVVESRGWTREVDASLVTPAVGDYVLIQMGVVLEVMDREAALETLRVLDRLEASGGA